MRESGTRCQHEPACHKRRGCNEERRFQPRHFPIATHRCHLDCSTHLIISAWRSKPWRLVKAALASWTNPSTHRKSAGLLTHDETNCFGEAACKTGSAPCRGCVSAQGIEGTPRLNRPNSTNVMVSAGPLRTVWSSAFTDEEEAGLNSERTPSTHRTTVYFVCPKCGQAYKARQLRAPQSVAGRFECVRCKSTVHAWSGDYDYGYWVPA
jgi:hypothetical protein